MEPNNTELFVTLATYPVHRTKSIDVEARIVSVGQEVYVGLYRKTYLFDEHLGIEIPKHKPLLIPVKAWYRLINKVQPLLENHLRRLVPLTTPQDSNASQSQSTLPTAQLTINSEPPAKKSHLCLNNGMHRWKRCNRELSFCSEFNLAADFLIHFSISA